MNKSGNFLAGLLTGALAGTVLALLYAPDTGKNTRDKLSYQLSNYRDELNDLIEQLRAEKQHLISEAKDKGDKVVLEAKQKADDLIKEAEGLLESIEGVSKG
ncbi:YtxH domain-containing protein [Balneola vulgaris]|jgi:gas vesicle protein|uniref:YtxH domain-containing protein n=1 Tax=Balneola vulgaris TaxID=287535 RepID=UPI0003791C68|nr:YtxH domain-containing protein [Balneola vulgaris]